MRMSIEARPGIAAITPYSAGEAVIEGRDTAIKLSSNESPFGPGPAAGAALRTALGDLGTYPSRDHAALRNAIAAAQGLDADRIVCGAGSDEILALIAQAFAGPGAEIVHPRHGFLMYPIIARSVGATPVAAGETCRRADIGKIVAACTDRTRIVYIANPSNPTGTMLDAEELAALADALPGSAVLVLDCAYGEFADGRDCGESLAQRRENVVMTRTFSKIHGLASLRIGYGYGPAAIIDVLNLVRGPFNVSGPAQAAAAAAAADFEHIERCRTHNAEWRAWLRRRLIDAGVGVDESFANFVMARFASADAARACDSWLRRDGIIVRRLEAYELPHCLRITIGGEAACVAAAESVEAFMRGGGQ